MVYSGNDDMVVPLLSLGGVGYISVIANIMPKESVEMSRSFLDGNIERARELQLSMKPLIDSMFADVNPIPVKVALAKMGMMELNFRLPLCPPTAEIDHRIETEMKKMGLI